MRAYDRSAIRRGGRAALAAAMLLLAAACGGEDPVDQIEVAEASQPCGDAFTSVLDASGADGEVDANLNALEPTLDACTGFDDWVAGARAHLPALPTQMDVETALVSLCRSQPDPSELAPCDDLSGDWEQLGTSDSAGS